MGLTFNGDRPVVGPALVVGESLETLLRAGRFAAGPVAQTAARPGADPPWGVQYPWGQHVS
jgi:hypothetical protein